MDERQQLANCFEADRAALIGLAHRMLGCRDEAEDAVQEVWLRLERIDSTTVRNLPGWLRTVTSRVCLDRLRSRSVAAQRNRVPDEMPDEADDPERKALEAESVGLALLVVLTTLSPAERVAFVLHDTFGVPFTEIAGILGRSQATAKKLASRARHKVRGHDEQRTAELDRHREVVAAFRLAARTGDTRMIAERLAPDVVRRGDRAALPGGRPLEVRGASAVAQEITVFGQAARHSAPALVDGHPGLLVAPGGVLRLAIRFVVARGLVQEYDLIADPVRLKRLRIRLWPE
jgi:RNA polymerase sigma factor (sigma-70 family)